jgi:hypothetical protein
MMLVDSKADILEEQRYSHDRTFVKCNSSTPHSAAQPETEKKSRRKKKGGQTTEEEEQQDSYIQGFVMLYKVTAKGGMQQKNQVPINMGRNFFPSQNGNMMLTRSRDKRRISLTNFDAKDPDGKYFKVMSWTTKLVECPVNPALNEGLNKYFNTVTESFHQLVEICYVGQCKYLMMVYVESVDRSLQD